MILLITSLIGFSVCAAACLLTTYHTYKDRKLPGYRLLVGVYVTHSIYYVAIAVVLVVRLTEGDYATTLPRIVSSVVVLAPAFALSRLALFLSGKMNG